MKAPLSGKETMHRRRSFRSLLLVHLAALAVLAIPAPSPHAADPLESLALRALRDNPGLKAQRALVEPSRQGVPQARALPDPSAELELMNIAVRHPNLSDALTTGISLGVTQALPFPGKRKLAADVAEQDVDAALARLRASEATVAADVREAAYQYVLQERLLDVNTATQDAQKAAAAAALAAYGAGRGNQADVLLAQSMETKTLADRDLLLRLLAEAKARMEDLLAGPVEPSDLAGIELPQPPGLPPLEDLLRAGDVSSPQVILSRTQVGVATAKAAQVRAEGRPDFMVGAKYRHKDMTMGGGDFVTASVGITLPFFHRKDRYGPAFQEALLRQQSSQSEAEAVRNDVRYRITQAYQEAVHDERLAALYRDGLLPQARQAYASMLASYTAGSADFTSLLTALTSLYNYQADDLTARGTFHAMVAQMEGLLGQPISQAATPHLHPAVLPPHPDSTDSNGGTP